MVDIRRADPLSDAMRPVIAAHFAHSQSAAPDQSNHTLEAGALAAPGIRLWGVFEGGRVLGCGALKTLPDHTAEVKSVHIVASARGRGLAKALMIYLADTARAQGLSALVLETGAAHLPGYDAARRLYESLGYAYCGPIFGYQADPNCAFMRLALEPHA
jgi:putative acetyltransferase